MRHFFRIAICVLLAGRLAAAAEIHGTVTDAQGVVVPGAAVIAQSLSAPVEMTASTQTGPEGGYSFSDLSPGTYVLRVQKAGFTEQRQGPLNVPLNAAAATVNFRLSPVEAETVRAAEERNPNDFVIRLDTNAITNEMSRAGVSPRLITEFRADRNWFGEQFGYPLRTIDTATPGRIPGAAHGSLYEFHQDHKLNARPFFQVGALLPSRRNDYGGSVSVPIRKERLAVSFAWGQVRDSGFVNGNIQVPLATERAARSGDPSLNAIINTFLTAFPKEVPNLPHVSLRHLNTNGLRSISSTAFSLHLDAQLFSADKVAFDQQFLNSVEEPFELTIGQNPRTKSRPQNLRFTYTHAFSPGVVGQLALNYDRLATVIELTERYQQLLAPLGITQAPDITLSDELSNLGIPGQGIPRERYENHYLVSPRLAVTRGRHSYAAGFSAMHLRDSDVRNTNGRGTYDFTSDFTIFDAAMGGERAATAVENFLLGRPSRFMMNVGNQYRGFRNWEYSAYFQDHFQVRQGLTLDYGLRYEAVTAPTEVHNLTHFLYQSDRNNFAPQFGFAWRPGWTKTVVRGGYGVAFGTLRVATYYRQVSNPPEVQTLSISAPDLREIVNLASLVPDPNRRAGLNLVSADLALPYSHLYSLTLERQLPADLLLKIGYQGSRAIKMYTGDKFNRADDVPGVEATSKTINNRRPDPRYLRIYQIGNGSIGYFDALQISATKRRTHGFAYDVRYSFSKSIETGMFNFADTGNAGGDDTQSDENIFGDVKAVSAFDAPHALGVTYSYELPVLPHTAWLGKALAHWTISGTTTLRSGTPFTFVTGSDAPGFGNVDGENGDRPNLLDPSILGRSFGNPDTSSVLMAADSCTVPGVLGGAGASQPYTRCKYFDTNLPVGGRGNLGFRTFRKDGTTNWNMAFARDFALPTGLETKLQFRTEFFNFFNHAQFSAPGNSISSPTFGQITNTVNKGRVVQLTLRILF